MQLFLVVKVLQISRAANLSYLEVGCILDYFFGPPKTFFNPEGDFKFQLISIVTLYNFGSIVDFNLQLGTNSRRDVICDDPILLGLYRVIDFQCLSIFTKKSLPSQTILSSMFESFTYYTK